LPAPVLDLDSCREAFARRGGRGRSAQNAPNKIAPTKANTAITVSMFNFKASSTWCSLLVDLKQHYQTFIENRNKKRCALQKPATKPGHCQCPDISQQNFRAY
jgi:hypothetical protein